MNLTARPAARPLFRAPPNPKDVVATPPHIAQDMIEFFEPSGLILDPCRGGGVFYDYLPDGSRWCEISDGVDFFDFNERVDWVIGNPPWSGFFNWIYHSMTLTDNVVYLLPADKPFISVRLLAMLREWGEIKHLRLYGTGRQLGFPVGFAVGAFHFQKGNKSGMTFSYYKENTF